MTATSNDATATPACPFTGELPTDPAELQALMSQVPTGHSAAVAGPSDTGASGSREAPVAGWVTIEDLHRDPFPIYRRLREEAAVHWVPAVNRFMVVSYDACHAIEQDEATFSADERESLMKRAMGHSMLRKDNPEHQVDRDSYGSTLRPGTIKKHWNGIFEANHARFMGEL
ncbi:MAG TPA: cytochrome P450, partial [Arthrobacter sp.]|nr:cytochrome P450 [Arthrobacter sp.]